MPRFENGHETLHQNPVITSADWTALLFLHTIQAVLSNVVLGFALYFYHNDFRGAAYASGPIATLSMIFSIVMIVCHKYRVGNWDRWAMFTIAALYAVAAIFVLVYMLRIAGNEIAIADLVVDFILIVVTLLAYAGGFMKITSILKAELTQEKPIDLNDPLHGDDAGIYRAIELERVQEAAEMNGNPVLEKIDSAKLPLTPASVMPHSDASPSLVTAYGHSNGDKGTAKREEEAKEDVKEEKEHSGGDKEAPSCTSPSTSKKDIEKPEVLIREDAVELSSELVAAEQEGEGEDENENKHAAVDTAASSFTSPSKSKKDIEKPEVLIREDTVELSSELVAAERESEGEEENKNKHTAVDVVAPSFTSPSTSKNDVEKPEHLIKEGAVALTIEQEREEAERKEKVKKQCGDDMKDPLVTSSSTSKKDIEKPEARIKEKAVALPSELVVVEREDKGETEKENKCADRNPSLTSPATSKKDTEKLLKEEAVALSSELVAVERDDEGEDENKHAAVDETAPSLTSPGTSKKDVERPEELIKEGAVALSSELVAVERDDEGEDENKHAAVDEAAPSFTSPATSKKDVEKPEELMKEGAVALTSELMAIKEKEDDEKVAPLSTCPATSKNDVETPDELITEVAVALSGEFMAAEKREKAEEAELKEEDKKHCEKGGPSLTSFSKRKDTERPEEIIKVALSSELVAAEREVEGE